MHSITSLFVFAFLATLALAAPTPKRSISALSSFKVPRVQNTKYVRNGKAAVAKAYAKFGWSITTTTTSTSDSNNDDEGSFFPWDGFGGSGSGFGSGSGSPATSVAVAATSAPAATSAAAAATTTAAATSASGADDASGAATSSAAAAAASGSGSVSGEASATSEESGSFYLSPVTIGTTKLNLDFDTGSADLWVYGPDAGAGQTTLDTSTDSTFKTLTGYTWSISYGDGSSASGTVGTDKVSIGGATVTSQAVEVATQVSSAFSEIAAEDGLLGLGFSNVNQVEPKQQKTFFANIQSQLEQPVFTVYLNESGEGEYEFGTIDSSKYTGDLTYVDVNSDNGYWEITSSTYQIGGVTGTNSNASPAIVDTGTTLMLLDDAVVTAYYAKVSGSSVSEEYGGWVYPCDADLPDFGVGLGSTGTFATVPGSYITYEKAGESTCYGGIQSNTGEDLQIFGDVFIRSQFVVFNGETPKLGVAAKA